MVDCSKCPIPDECGTINEEIRGKVIAPTETLCPLKIVTKWAGGILKDMSLCPVKFVQSTLLDERVKLFLKEDKRS